MFEHARAALQAQISAAQAGVQQALAAQDAARVEIEGQSNQIPPLQQALLQEQAALQQAARDAAAQTLATHTDQEPESVTDVSGKVRPNPGHAQWAKVQAQLQAALSGAQAALDTASSAFGQAQQARDAAVGAVNAASAGVTTVQNQIAAAMARINVTQQRYNAALAAVGAGQQVVAQLTGQVAALDVRASRLVAVPLDRADLELAADAELTDLLARRYRRHDLLVQRAGVFTDRASTLAAQDATADAADALRREIADALLREPTVWPDAARNRSVASALPLVDAVVADSRTQRTRPPQERTDDLQAASSRLRTVLTSLQDELQHVITERDVAVKALTMAAQDIVNHEKVQP